MKHFTLTVLSVCLGLGAGVSFVRPASASEFLFLPESRHQQYKSIAFLTEEHSSLLLRSAGYAWGALRGSLALAEASDWPGSPQLVAHGSANVGYQFDRGKHRLDTETIDARVGLWLNFEPKPKHHVSLGWTHLSGHVSDDLPDMDLFGSNLGWEVLRARFIYSGWDGVRIGASLKPIIGSDPPMKVFSADQFVEWFPFGWGERRNEGKPYVSLGLEQMAVDHYVLTTQLQAGVQFGNVSRPVHEPSLRLALGYWNGMDPRLKYLQFKRATTDFVFLGLFADI